MPDVTEFRFDVAGDRGFVERVAKHAEKLLRERAVPALRGISPVRTGKLKRGWFVKVDDENPNVIRIGNSVWYSKWAGSKYRRQEWADKVIDTIKRHAEEAVGEAVKEVGLPLIRDRVAAAMKDAVRGRGLRAGRSGVSMTYKRGRG